MCKASRHVEPVGTATMVASPVPHGIIGLAR